MKRILHSIAWTPIVVVLLGIAACDSDDDISPAEQKRLEDQQNTSGLAGLWEADCQANPLPEPDPEDQTEDLVEVTDSIDLEGDNGYFKETLQLSLIHI